MERKKTRILCPVPFLRKSCRSLDNVEKCGRAGETMNDYITLQMHCACWITKATDIDSVYVIFTLFPWLQWLRERTSVLGYSLRALAVLFKVSKCLVHHHELPYIYR